MQDRAAAGRHAEQRQALQITDLHKTYESRSGRKVSALRGVNLAVDEGEFIAILGPSGAGKSTLIRCINRLVQPTRGEILWYGEPVTTMKPRQLRQLRRQMGMIFQEFNLIDRLSVRTNVLVGAFGRMKLWPALLGSYGAADVARMRSALARVGLADYETQRVSELSGGQRQRVGIARALVQEPRLILGDEPVSSLDPVTAEAVLELLKEINGDDGMTMMINLHSVVLARRFASRVIGMSQGKIVFDGSPGDLDARMTDTIYRRSDSS